jgi:hypothetical protein
MKGTYQSTSEYASENLVKHQTILRRFCLTGSYFGVIPKKLPNGRLAWPIGESLSREEEAA